MTKQEYLKELINEKDKAIWVGEWELGFLKEYKPEFLTEGALETARASLAMAREKSEDSNKVLEADQRVQDVKAYQKQTKQVEQVIKELQAQKAYLEKRLGEEYASV